MEFVQIKRRLRGNQALSGGVSAVLQYGLILKNIWSCGFPTLCMASHVSVMSSQSINLLTLFFGIIPVLVYTFASNWKPVFLESAERGKVTCNWPNWDSNLQPQDLKLDVLPTAQWIGTWPILIFTAIFFFFFSLPYSLKKIAIKAKQTKTRNTYGLGHNSI